MKKLILLIFVLNSTFSMAQTSIEPIRINKVFGGYHFYQGENKLRFGQLAETMKSNEKAYSMIKTAQNTYFFAQLVGGAGGFCIGWPIGEAIAGGDPNWILAGIGAGLIAVSIPITSSFNKKVKKAVDTFNTDLKTGSCWDGSELKLSLTGNGIGLIFQF